MGFISGLDGGELLWSLDLHGHRGGRCHQALCEDLTINPSSVT